MAKTTGINTINC